MADLPSILGGMAQGFLDFGKSAVDLFGTGGASIADLIESARTGKVTTKNSDDFRKWLYETNDTKDAAAKGLGTALNGVQTVSDYIPGIGAVTRNPLFNAGQGALGGLADEFKMYGKDYDLARAGERAAVSSGGALAASSLGDALKNTANPLLSSGTVQGLARGATGGAITAGGYAGVDGGDVLQSALQGAGTGALIGGATGAIQDFKPAKTYDVALTDEEKAARIANIDDQLSKLDTSTPEGNARYNELMNAWDNYLPTTRNYRTFATGDEAREYFSKNNPAYWDGLPSSVDEGIQEYTRNGYSRVNDMLRTGQDNYGYPDTDVLIGDIERGIEGYNLPDDIKVYRRSMADAYKNLNVGDTFTDEGFTSTSISPNIGGDFGKANIEINVGNGKGVGAFIGDLSSGNGDEGEFLLQRGTKYKVVGKDGDKLKLEVVGNERRPLEDILSASDLAINDAKLTPEQEAYFKDSVMRDAEGKLMPVYHSSPNKFTAFDDSRLGENTAYSNTAFGHFVTPDADFSSRFMDIDNRGVKGNTMELYADVKKPITHPYNADYKYKGADLDNIVENYYKAIDDVEDLNYLKQAAKDNGTSLYEAYVDNMDMDYDPFETAKWDREALMKKGYDAVEMVEGLKSGLVEGSEDNTPISSYAIFSGKQLKDVNNLNPTGDPDIRYSKAASGQSLEKTLANGDAEINRVGSANVAPVDTKTLPKSLQAAQEYLNEGNYIKDIENFAGKPYPKLTNQDYLDYAISLKNPKDREFYESIIKDMVDDGTTTYEKYAASAARNNRLNKLRMGSYDDIDPKALASYIANHRQALSNGTIRDVDAELSDRLGIGRSNTLMMDNNLPPDALGAYDPTNSTISIDTNAPEENLVNTLAHERLHSFQTEGDFKRYDKRVTDAYEELSKDLNKYLKTPEETAKRYAFDTDYWGNEREQQSRMLQQYLENKGFTRGGLQKSNAGEWGNEINPAFDKFFDKLRDLSKRGVALPALAALFGGGAYMASQENDKEKEVK